MAQVHRAAGLAAVVEVKDVALAEFILAVGAPPHTSHAKMLFAAALRFTGVSSFVWSKWSHPPPRL